MIIPCNFALLIKDYTAYCRSKLLYLSFNFVSCFMRVLLLPFLITTNSGLGHISATAHFSYQSTVCSIVSIHYFFIFSTEA